MAMRADRDIEGQAEQLSAAIDQMLAEARGAEPEGVRAPVTPKREPVEAGLLDTARQLAQLPTLLGPIEPPFERQVMRSVRTAGQRSARRRRRLSRLRLGWAAAGLVTVVLLLVLLVTPLGGAAVASFQSIFHLGRTDIQITQAATPAVTAGAAGVRQRLTLQAAQDLVPFQIPKPDYLPPGYRLLEVNGYSYPDLPPWVPQPLFVEMVYGDKAGAECALRAYPLVLGPEASISALNLEATSVEKVHDVVIDGQPGVLLRVGGGAWQEMVWEQGALVLALSSDDLPEAEMIRVAQSVGQ